MKTINLRDFYPWYTSDKFIDVSDEVAGVLTDAARLERNYTERVRYNKAYYSLDAGDGIENEACYINLSPHEIYERQLIRCRLCCALNSLSETQGTRVDAHYILGMERVTRLELATSTLATRKVKYQLVKKGAFQCCQMRRKTALQSQKNQLSQSPPLLL